PGRGVPQCASSWSLLVHPPFPSSQYWLAASSPRPPPPQGPDANPSAPVLTAFHQLGCVEQSGNSPDPEVIIPARDGGRYVLTCLGADEDQIARPICTNGTPVTIRRHAWTNSTIRWA